VREREREGGREGGRGREREREGERDRERERRLSLFNTHQSLVTVCQVTVLHPPAQDDNTFTLSHFLIYVCGFLVVYSIFDVLHAI
jgi:hypothetical protein